MTAANADYVLATGTSAEARLAVLNEVHGPDSREFLLRAGLQPGMRVLEVGCGSGNMALWMAQQVGPSGSVVACDVSAEQVEVTARRAEATELGNINTWVASAESTGLKADSFDLVYARFVLMHLGHPNLALDEVRRLLKPGGTLAVEDGDFCTPFACPPSKAFDRAFELYRELGEKRGRRFQIGSELYGLVRAAGFEEISMHLSQPVYARGPEKHLPDWTLEECASALIAAGLTTDEELSALLGTLRAIAANEEIVIGMVRMTQVFARKSH